MLFDTESNLDEKGNLRNDVSQAGHLVGEELMPEGFKGTASIQCPSPTRTCTELPGWHLSFCRSWQKLNAQSRWLTSPVVGYF